MTNHARVAQYFPDAYRGTITRNGQTMSVIEVATLDEIAEPILRRYGDWAVTTDAVMCLTTEYSIGLEQLDDQPWIDRMGEKSWVNVNDFAAAWRDAKEMVSLGIISPSVVRAH